MCRLGCEIVKKTGQGAKDFRTYGPGRGFVGEVIKGGCRKSDPRGRGRGGLSAVVNRTNTGRTIRTLKMAKISSGP